MIAKVVEFFEFLFIFKNLIKLTEYCYHYNRYLLQGLLN